MHDSPPYLLIASVGKGGYLAWMYMLDEKAGFIFNLVNETHDVGSKKSGFWFSVIRKLNRRIHIRLSILHAIYFPFSLKQ